jgi:hypothetical protein
MLRCRSIAALQRAVSTPPLVDFSRASPLDLFEQPARGFFQQAASLDSQPRTTVNALSTAMIAPIFVIATWLGLLLPLALD